MGCVTSFLILAHVLSPFMRVLSASHMSQRKMIFLIWIIHALLTGGLAVYLSGTMLAAGTSNQDISLVSQMLHVLVSILSMPLGPLAAKFIDTRSLQLVFVVLTNSFIWAFVISLALKTRFKNART